VRGAPVEVRPPVEVAPPVEVVPPVELGSPVEMVLATVIPILYSSRLRGF